MSIVIYNEIDLHHSKICTCMNNIFLTIIPTIYLIQTSEYKGKHVCAFSLTLNLATYLFLHAGN